MLRLNWRRMSSLTTRNGRIRASRSASDATIGDDVASGAADATVEAAEAAAAEEEEDGGTGRHLAATKLHVKVNHKMQNMMASCVCVTTIQLHFLFC